MIFEETVKTMANAMKNANEKKTTPYDSVATVTRVEDGVAWVHIAGGVDETPVKMTIDCKEGDEVQVRVSGGRAWIAGNATAPPTDDTLAIEAKKTAETANESAETALDTAGTAKDIAEATNQHFWTDDNGVHVASQSKNATAERNTLWNSLGMLFRKGSNVLLGILTGENPSVAIYDGQGNSASNIVANFGATVTVGKTDGTYFEVDNNGTVTVKGHDANNNSLTYQKLSSSDSFFQSRLPKTVLGTLYRFYTTVVNGDGLRMTEDRGSSATVGQDYYHETVALNRDGLKFDTGETNQSGQIVNSYSVTQIDGTDGGGFNQDVFDSNGNLLAYLHANAELIELYGDITAEGTVTASEITSEGAVNADGNIKAKGSITAHNHSSAIGTVKQANSNKTITTTGIDTYTQGASVTLEAGTWVVIGTWVFQTGSSTGARNMTCALSTSSGSANSGMLARTRVHANSNAWASLQATYLATFSSSTTVYVKGSSTMTYTTEANTDIRAVRIA